MFVYLIGVVLAAVIVLIGRIVSADFGTVVCWVVASSIVLGLISINPRAIISSISVRYKRSRQCRHWNNLTQAQRDLIRALDPDAVPNPDLMCEKDGRQK